MEVIDIMLVQSGEVYKCNTNGKITNPGEGCIVETDNAREFATVISDVIIVDKKHFEGKTIPLIRMATKSDQHRLEVNARLEKEGYEKCLKKIQYHKLPMKLVSVNYFFDQTKILFFFTADHRVDFRALVKDLATTFKTRIELRQIGLREEARIIGGYGMCGLELCCKRGIIKFGKKGQKEIVSIKQAKMQDLSLSSSKITGCCGRLMCCIAYEYDFYRNEKKNYPKLNSQINYKNDKHTVISVNVITQQVLLRSPEDMYVHAPLSELIKQDRPQKQQKNQN